VTDSSTACAINSTNPAAIDIISGSGTCVVRVVKVTDGDYRVDNDLLTVLVHKLDQDTITITGPTEGTYGDTALPVTFTGGTGTGAVSYSVNDSDACAINDTDASAIDITAGEGTCTLTVIKAGDDNYNAASSDVVVETTSPVFGSSPSPFSVTLKKKTSSLVLASTIPTDGTYLDEIDLSDWVDSYVGTGVFTYTVGLSTGCEIDSVIPSQVNIINGVGWCLVRVMQAAESRNWKRSHAEANIDVHRAAADDVAVLVRGDSSIQTAHYGDSGIALSATWGPVGSGSLHIEANSTVTTGCVVSGASDGDSPTASLAITEGDKLADGTTSSRCRVRAILENDDYWSVSYDGVNVILLDRPITITAGAETAKTYNGDAASAGTPTVTAGSLADGDVLSGCAQTFDTAGAGTAKTLTVTPNTCVITHTAGSIIETRNYDITLATRSDGAIGKVAQATVTVLTPGSGVYGDKLTPSASGGSTTATPTFTASGTGCSMGSAGDAGKLLITAGSGTCEITAHKAGDANYNDADSGAATVSVGQREITISASSGASKDYDTTTTSSGTPTLTGGTLADGDVLSGCVQSFDSADVGTAKTVAVGPATCVIKDAGPVNQTSNYSITLATRSDGAIAKIGQAALRVDSPSSGTNAEKLIPTASGGSGSGSLTFTASGTACSMGSAGDVGKLLITAGSGTCEITAHKAGDANYNDVDSSSATVTISKSAQAALTALTPGSGVYGEKLIPTASGGSGSGSLTFTASGTACSMGTAGDAGKLLITAGSGTCDITAHKADDATYSAVDSSPKAVTITKRAATVGFTGSQFWATANANATTASVTFTGTVTAAPGGSVYLSNATVEFLIYASTNVLMTTPDYTCSAAANVAGVATCTKTLGLDNWTVVMRVADANAYFTSPLSDPAVVTVYPPTTDRYTHGGGWLLEPAIPGSPTVGGSPTNNRASFGFSMRYKSGSKTTPWGQLVYTFRGADGYDYVVKSTSWTGGGLAFGTGAASFSGKATVTRIRPESERCFSYYDRDHPTTKYYSAPSYTFRVDVADKSAGDTFAITVSSALGVLYHRAGTTAVQIKISGGNITVH